MDRTKFYQKVYNDSTEVDELDYLWSNLNRFTTIYQPTQYRLAQSDLMRPDLVSYRNYGSVTYWWLLCYLNGVEDPLLDMEEGDVWTIPSLADVFNFIKKYKLR